MKAELASLNLALIAAFSLAVLGIIIYHGAAKAAPSHLSPFELIALAYATGFVISVVGGAAIGQVGLSGLTSWEVLRPAIWIGIGVCAIEFGIVLAYRAGLPLSIGAISVNATATLLLVPVGILFFREGVSPMRLTGIALAIIGLVLMALSTKTP